MSKFSRSSLKSFNLLIGLAVLFAVSHANAQTVVSNLQVPDVVFGFPIGAEFSAGVASSFVTGPDVFRFDSVTIRMNDEGSNPENDIMVRLFADDGTGTTFGEEIELLTGFGRPLDAGLFVYSSVGTVLDTNEKYWIRLTTDSFNGSYLAEATTTSGIAPDNVPGWDKPLETDFGQNNSLVFSIQASPVTVAVPEPCSSAALFLIMAGTASLIRRRGR